MEEMDKLTFFRYFPNPVKNRVYFQLQLKEPGKTTIDLLDIGGRHVSNISSANLDFGWHSFDFDTSHLSAGIYLVKLQIDGTPQLSKLTIIK